ncbi:hypothetical protein [Rhodoferax antarcticus]|uniref:hypothetical protein n=1 Tax=Rhodoferax antarcticus TaxID=81479 RepID=UPI00094FA748|nr:hypothetical protein [Rhodoferax antarcticus]APW47339.1 hypothetical protein RA876_14335 [Rhodoferax antarcticus]
MSIQTIQQFPNLLTEQRPTVNTATAAHWLSRRPQTMRIWACREDGPIRPIRINGRLAWNVASIRNLVGV